MILVDANLLIYAQVEGSRQHVPARDWLNARLNGSAPVGLPWHSILGYLRIVTNPRIVQSPVSVGDAWAVVQYWLECPPVWIPQPTERHRETLGGLIESVEPSGNLIPDTFLAALAIEHGLTLCSADGDFARFPALRYENPLAPR